MLKNLNKKWEEKKNLYVKQKLLEVSTVPNQYVFKKSKIHVYGFLFVSNIIFSYFMYLFSFDINDSTLPTIITIGVLLGLFFTIFCLKEWTYRIEFKDDYLNITNFFSNEKVELCNINKIYVNGKRNRIEITDSKSSIHYVGLELDNIYVFLKQLNEKTSLL